MGKVDHFEEDQFLEKTLENVLQWQIELTYWYGWMPDAIADEEKQRL